MKEREGPAPTPSQITESAPAIGHAAVISVFVLQVEMTLIGRRRSFMFDKTSATLSRWMKHRFCRPNSPVKLTIKLIGLLAIIIIMLRFHINPSRVVHAVDRDVSAGPEIEVSTPDKLFAR